MSILISSTSHEIFIYLCPNDDDEETALTNMIAYEADMKLIALNVQKEDDAFEAIIKWKDKEYLLEFQYIEEPTFIYYN